MFLIRIIRISDWNRFFELILAAVEITVLLLLIFYLCRFLVKKFFSKMYEGNSILNKALPFFMTSFGALILLRMLVDVAGELYYMVDFEEEYNYFSAVLFKHDARLPVLVTFMGLSLY